jgi:hypothetical protein
MHTDCDDLVGLTSPWTAARDGRVCRELRDKVYVPENWNRYTSEFCRFIQADTELLSSSDKAADLYSVHNGFVSRNVYRASKAACRALPQFLVMNKGDNNLVKYMAASFINSYSLLHKMKFSPNSTYTAFYTGAVR